MRNRFLLAGVLLLGVVVLVRADGGDSSSNYALVGGGDDQAALERGEWRVVGAISRGKELPKELLEKMEMRMVFKGNTLSQKSGGPGAAARTRDTTFKLNSNGRPKEIDWNL